MKYEELIITIGIIVFAAIQTTYINYRRKKRIVMMTQSPILLSYYTEYATILPIARGEHNGYKYAAYVLMSGIDGGSSVLIEVYLPFKTKLHLLGITKRHGMDQISTDGMGSLMEKVSLEGDYNNHFSLYADKGMQTQARYMLDPKAMAFTVDFCKSHSWEIVGSEFYFVQQSVPNYEDDDTYMWDDVERFIEEIRPAVEIPLTKRELELRKPYNEVAKELKRREDLKCPICTGILRYTTDMYECLNHDGILIHGSKINKLRRGKLAPTISSNFKHVQRSDSLICPYCDKQMQTTLFAGSKTTIDICEHCHNRWLDSGELVGLKNHYL